MSDDRALQQVGIAGFLSFLRSRLPAILQLSLTLLVLGHSSLASAQDSDLDPRIAQLVASISAERLGVILKKLESFETRSTLSSTTSATRGIGAARQWIFDEMKGYSPKLRVAFDSYQVVPQGRITRMWNCAT